MADEEPTTADTEAEAPAPEPEPEVVEGPKQKLRDHLAESRSDAGPSVLDLLENRAYLQQIDRALAGTMNPERFIRVVRTVVRRDDRLAGCDGASVVGAAMQAAQLGLVPGPELGECFLVSAWDEERACHVATFQLGYKGIIRLAFQSDLVKDISAMPVKENDDFEISFGTDDYSYLMHRPAYDAGPGRGQAVGYWALVNYTTGGRFFDYFTLEEINTIRYRFSRSPESGPWKTSFDQMARKTALRQIRGHLPLSPAAMSGLAADESVHFELDADLAGKWAAENPGGTDNDNEPDEAGEAGEEGEEAGASEAADD